jgi:hypothetical protein
VDSIISTVTLSYCFVSAIYTLDQNDANSLNLFVQSWQILYSLIISIQFLTSLGAVSSKVVTYDGVYRSSKPTTGPRNYISIWLTTGELVWSLARQISMSPWIIVVIQSTSMSVGAIIHDGSMLQKNFNPPLPRRSCRARRLLCGGKGIGTQQSHQPNLYFILFFPWNISAPAEAWGVVHVPSTEQRDSLERCGKEVSSRS